MQALERFIRLSWDQEHTLSTQAQILQNQDISEYV